MAQETPPAPRYHALDALRASMMLLGLALHAATNYMAIPAAEWGYQDRSNSLLFNLLVLLIHVFRMPAFFVMSGFFGALLWERRGRRGFADNRARRVLLPLVLVWPFAYVSVRAGFLFAQASAEGRPDALRFALTSRPEISLSAPGLLTHLWFLYYLALFCACAVALGPLFARLPEGARRGGAGLFRRALLSPLRTPLFALVTLPFLAAMTYGFLETDPRLTPSPLVLTVYALFFAVGWLLWGQRDLLPTFMRGAGGRALLSLPLLLVSLIVLKKAMPQGMVPGAAMPFGPRLTVAACGALMAWLLIFGLIGLFWRCAASESPRWRYLSDASYWVYLAHLPVIPWLAGLMAGQGWPSGVKFLLCAGGALVVTLVTYDLLVRPTWVGALLNGRRHPRGLT